MSKIFTSRSITFNVFTKLKMQFLVVLCFFKFDNCDSMASCWWEEATPSDYLNFVIVKVQDLIDNGSGDEHGPVTDPSNSTLGGQ